MIISCKNIKNFLNFILVDECERSEEKDQHNDDYFTNVRFEYY